MTEGIDWERAAADVPPDIRKHALPILFILGAAIVIFLTIRRQQAATAALSTAAVAPTTTADTSGQDVIGTSGTTSASTTTTSLDPVQQQIALNQAAESDLQTQLGIKQADASQTELLREQGATFDSNLSVSTAKNLGAVTLDLTTKQGQASELLREQGATYDLGNTEKSDQYSELLREQGATVDLRNQVALATAQEAITEQANNAAATITSAQTAQQFADSQAAARQQADLQMQEDNNTANNQRQQAAGATNLATATAAYQSALQNWKDAQAKADTAKAAIPVLSLLAGKNNQAEVNQATSQYNALQASADQFANVAAALKPAS